MKAFIMTATCFLGGLIFNVTGPQKPPMLKSELGGNVSVNEETSRWKSLVFYELTWCFLWVYMYGCITHYIWVLVFFFLCRKMFNCPPTSATSLNIILYISHFFQMKMKQASDSILLSLFP